MRMILIMVITASNIFYFWLIFIPLLHIHDIRRGNRDSIGFIFNISLYKHMFLIKIVIFF